MMQIRKHKKITCMIKITTALAGLIFMVGGAYGMQALGQALEAEREKVKVAERRTLAANQEARDAYKEKERLQLKVNQMQEANNNLKKINGGLEQQRAEFQHLLKEVVAIAGKSRPNSPLLPRVKQTSSPLLARIRKLHAEAEKAQGLERELSKKAEKEQKLEYKLNVEAGRSQELERRLSVEAEKKQGLERELSKKAEKEQKLEHKLNVEAGRSQELERRLSVEAEKKQGLERELSKKAEKEQKLEHKLNVEAGRSQELERRLSVEAEKKQGLEREISKKAEKKQGLERELSKKAEKEQELEQKLNVEAGRSQELERELSTKSARAEELEQMLSEEAKRAEELEESLNKVAKKKTESERRLTELKLAIGVDEGEVSPAKRVRALSGSLNTNTANLRRSVATLFQQFPDISEDDIARGTGNFTEKVGILTEDLKRIMAALTVLSGQLSNVKGNNLEEKVEFLLQEVESKNKTLEAERQESEEIVDSILQNAEEDKRQKEAAYNELLTVVHETQEAADFLQDELVRVYEGTDCLIGTQEELQIQLLAAQDEAEFLGTALSQKQLQLDHVLERQFCYSNSTQ